MLKNRNVKTFNYFGLPCCINDHQIKRPNDFIGWYFRDISRKISESLRIIFKLGSLIIQKFDYKELLHQLGTWN